MHFQDRWKVQEPIGRKGGMLQSWSNRVDIKHIWMNDFCIEVKIECQGENVEIWLIFVYRSTDSKERQEQWNFLREMKQMWGKNWVIGGDCNDIRSKEKSKEARRDIKTTFNLLELL